MQQFIFDAWNIPFEATVILSILLIWVYTQREELKPSFGRWQTSLMIIAVFLSIAYINQALKILSGLQSQVSQYNEIFVTDSFLKEVIS